MELHPWRRKKSSPHVDCKVYEIARETWFDPGREIEDDFFVINLRDWAVCLAFTPEQELVLVRQFRFGSGTFSWEFPAGLVDPGESPLDAGLRECREETGYTGSEAQILGSVEPNPALQNNRCHFILLKNAILSHPQEPDEHEAFEVKTFPVNHVIRMAQNGEITHGMIHAALFFLTHDAEKPS